MEFQFQSPYVTAPASPMAGYGGVSSAAAQFYSVPASPTSSWAANNAFSVGDDGASSRSCSNFDSFEFETSRKFGDAAAEDDRGERRRERGGSLPSMAFADQLFDNGRVMPLKPPPRFRIDGGGGAKSCSSPKSPGSMFRVPFSRRNVWNDDYDPFMAALQKVKEENRGRKSISMYGDDHHHRRTRSFSPFRRINGEDEWGFNNKETVIGPIEPAEPKAEPKPKGSTYARWVLNQTQSMGRSPKQSTTTKKTRPNKPTSNGGNTNSEDTKMQKIKGIIVKYTSFGNGNSEGKEVKNPISSIFPKSNYFKKFSFKYKVNRRENRNQNQDKNENRNGNGEPRIVLVKLQPPMCLGYGVQSPRK
nr:hypothetical protein CQW23_26387 [Ipomoea batatas]GME04295.1 hypothetical protein CQW23_26387 [Ipomoea batatas]